MTYFQFDKNPKRALETDDDYDKYAKACYKQAMDFSYLCMETKDLMLSEHSIAWFTNVAFSCELFLKYYLYCCHIDSKKFVRLHDLYDLFKLLPEDLQNEIIDCHPEKRSREDFELNLKELGKAFIALRYSFERDSIAFGAKFLALLFEELYTRTQPI